MLRQDFIRLGFGLGLAILSPWLAQAEPTFVSREGRFLVAFPAPPQGAQSARDTWAGRMEEGSFEVERQALRLRVEFHDVPGLATRVLPSGVILDLARQGVLDDMHAHEESVERTSLRGHPGLALRYTPAARPGSTEEARIFLVGSRLYVAFARADLAGEDRALAERFLTSFDAWEPGEAVAMAAGSATGGR